MAAGINPPNPNDPPSSIDDSRYVRMGHTDGPYGNDPNIDARGDFGKPPKDLRP